MNQLTKLLVASLISIPVFAEGASIVDKSQARSLNPSYDNGLASCRDEIRRGFDRSDRLIFSRMNFVDRSQVESQRTFYVNATVNKEGTKGEHRKQLGFTCETNLRGNSVVSINQIDGRYVKSGPAASIIVAR